MSISPICLLFTIVNIPLVQEVYHTLLECLMWDSSRKYCTLNISEVTSDEASFGQHQNALPFYKFHTIHPEELKKSPSMSSSSGMMSQIISTEGMVYMGQPHMSFCGSYLRGNASLSKVIRLLAFWSLMSI